MVTSSSSSSKCHVAGSGTISDLVGLGVLFAGLEAGGLGAGGLPILRATDFGALRPLTGSLEAIYKTLKHKRCFETIGSSKHTRTHQKTRKTSLKKNIKKIMQPSKHHANQLEK